MAVYTVHQPPMRNASPLRQFERFKFIRDGFSFWAFLFGPLWLLRHRLWLGLIGYFVLVATVAVALAAAGASGVGLPFIALLFAVLIGLEANSLRRWTFSRRGWSNVGVVVGGDRPAAERRFFDAWLSRSSAAAPQLTTATPPAPQRPPLGANDVVGLFPEPGGRL